MEEFSLNATSVFVVSQPVTLQMSFFLDTGFLDTSKRMRSKRLTPFVDYAPDRVVERLEKSHLRYYG